MKTGFGSLRQGCAPTTQEQAQSGTAVSNQPRSAHGSTVTTERGTGLLSRLKSRLSKSESNFDLGLKTVVKQNADHAATLRSRSSETISPQTGGRSGLVRTKIADIVNEIAGPHPAMVLIEPGEIPEPNQVQRPEKGKFGRMRATVADRRHSIRSELREAPSGKLNDYLNGEHRRQALKEIGKRKKYGRLDAEVDGVSNPSVASDANVSVNLAEPAKFEQIRSSEVDEPSFEQPALKPDAQQTIGRPSNEKTQLFDKRAYDDLFLWSYDSFVRDRISDAKLCANERVAKVAKTVPITIARTLWVLREVRIKSSAAGIQTTLSAADLRHKAQHALAEMLHCLDESRLALARECVDDRPGRQEALNLNSVLEDLEHSLAQWFPAPHTSLVDLATTDEVAVQTPTDLPRRIAKSIRQEDGRNDGAEPSRDTSEGRPGELAIPASTPPDTGVGSGPLARSASPISPVAQATTDEGAVQKQNGPNNRPPRRVRFAPAPSQRSAESSSSGTRTSKTPTGSKSALRRPALHSYPRIGASSIESDTPSVPAPAREPANPRTSRLENDEMVKPIRQTDGRIVRAEASRVASEGGPGEQSIPVSTPFRAVADSDLLKPSPSPTSAFAAQPANRRHSWVAPEMAELIRKVNGWDKSAEPARDVSEGGRDEQEAPMPTPSRALADSGLLEPSASPASAPAAKPANRHPSWIENDATAKLIQELNGWNDGAGAPRDGIKGERSARAGRLSTPARTRVDRGPLERGHSPISAPASEPALQRFSWLENESIAKEIINANGWNRGVEAPREENEGQRSGEES